MWMRVGEGSKPFANSTTSPTSRPPRVCGLVQRGRAAGEGQEVGVGVGGWVQEAAMLPEEPLQEK